MTDPTQPNPNREVESGATGGMMEFDCKTHGKYDPLRHWGCPECVVELRNQRAELQRTLEESQRSETILTAKYSDAIAVCEHLQSELSALKEKVPYELLESLLAEFPESRFMSMRRQQTAIAVKVVRELRADQSKLKAQVEELRAAVQAYIDYAAKGRFFDEVNTDELKAALAKGDAG